MKKIIALLTALVLLLSLSACSLKKAPAPAASPEPVAETTASPVAETPAPAEEPAEPEEPALSPAFEEAPIPEEPSELVHEVEVEAKSEPSGDPYDAVLQTYTSALKNSWSREQCINANISYLVPGYTDMGNAELLGYCYYDVNGDNVPELLIGDGTLILSMYTQMNGAAVNVFEGGERSSYYLEPDGVIVNRGSNSAAQGGYRFYELSGSAMNYKGAIIWDYGVNYDAPWYYAYDQDWDVSNDEKVSNATAHKWVEAYESNYVAPAYISFLTGERAVNKAFNAIFYAADVDDYGYQMFRAPQSGDYEFTVNGSAKVEWDVFVLDQEFTDAKRFIPQAYPTMAHNGGTVHILEGQFVYVYCSANNWTTIEAPVGCSLSCTLK